MPCTHCKKENVIAKGLCRSCYYRLRKTGSLEYKRKGKPERQCEFDGCTKPHAAKGLCNTHYMSVYRTGEPVSLFGYSDRRKHPLYESWRYQIRCAQGRCDEWNDFWAFVEHAKQKPSKDHKAYRYDVNVPWGPDNFYWKELDKSKDPATKQRKWRESNPLNSKNTALKKVFGIGIKEYISMYEAQDGRCAICGNEGLFYDKGLGRTKTLAVDHCHDTGKIRGLLCSRCNRGLGMFNDSIELLEKAVKYLKKYS